jgi:hypothetical protein
LAHSAGASCCSSREPWWAAWRPTSQRALPSGVCRLCPGRRYDLAEIIREHDAGDDVELTILRDSDDTEILQLEVTLGENRNEEGELVTYLGLWYRYLRSGMSVVPQSGGSRD